MAVPEDKLTQWAQIGAQTTSQETYATIKLALESEEAGYHSRAYKVFLQGSYCNDTNIIKESDVDVVIRLDSVYYYDITPLPAQQQTAFMATHPAAEYTAKAFHAHVMEVLVKRFAGDAVPGTKAVAIKPRNNRRKADVLVAVQHKKFTRFAAVGDESQLTGLCFFKSDGTKVVNYPTMHRENLAAKNQDTNEWMKHLIRIFKNARQVMIDRETLKAGQAPSYFIEGLLYNVPDAKFGGTYSASVVGCINWLYQADRSTFVCANRQYKLLDDNPDVSWNTKDCDVYLKGLISLWNNWTA